MNIKRKHHFVSQFYLKRWENSENRILMWNGKDSFKPKPSKVESIAYGKNIYKISPLKLQQIELFHNYIRANNLEGLSTYNLVFKEIVKTQQLFDGISELADLLDIDLSGDLDGISKDIAHNTFEDKFSYDEEKFSKVLDKIITQSSPCITLNDYDILVYFIAFQMVKTPKKIDNITKLDKQNEFYNDYNFTEEEHRTFILFMSQCLSEAFYLSWLTKVVEIRVYKNISNIDFITSDDPCFNQKLHQKNILVQLPISPKHMIELRPNSYSKEQSRLLLNYLNLKKEDGDTLSVNQSLVKFDNLKQKEVENLNSKIFRNRDRFVYAMSQKDIDSITL